MSPQSVLGGVVELERPTAVQKTPRPANETGPIAIRTVGRPYPGLRDGEFILHDHSAQDEGDFIFNAPKFHPPALLSLCPLSLLKVHTLLIGKLNLHVA